LIRGHQSGGGSSDECVCLLASAHISHCHPESIADSRRADGQRKHLGSWHGFIGLSSCNLSVLLNDIVEFEFGFALRGLKRDEEASLFLDDADDLMPSGDIRQRDEIGYFNHVGSAPVDRVVDLGSRESRGCHRASCSI